MAVTEVALLKFTAPDGTLTTELISLLEDAQKIQDKWVLARDPTLPDDRTARGTAMFQQLEDPSVVFITAQWSSPEGHGEWIESEENKAVMGKLAAQLEDGGNNVTLFHIDSEAFTNIGEGQQSALTAPVLSMERFRMKDGGKDGFQKVFDKTKWLMEECSKPYPVQGGWRIEKEHADEFLVFSGWESTDQHWAAAKHENYSEWLELRSFVVDTPDVKHYKRIV